MTPKHLANEITPVIRQKRALTPLSGELRRTVDAVVKNSKGTVPIITHGYDYAHPSGQGFSILGGLITTGPWILPNFIEKRIDDLEEQVVIVNALVDGFNELLSDLASGSASGIDGFNHVDFRNTLSINDWADELHPTAPGRDKLASILREEIVRVC